MMFLSIKTPNTGRFNQLILLYHKTKKGDEKMKTSVVNGEDIDHLIEKYSDVISYHELSCHYVSEEIDKILAEMKRVNFLHAGCGRGKNTMDEEIIIRHIEPFGKKITIAVDRVCNLLQMKKRIAKMLDRNDLLKLSDAELKEIDRIGSVQIQSYQKIAENIFWYKKALRNLEKGIYQKGIRNKNDLLQKYGFDMDFIVYDEVHSMTLDAFNSDFAELLSDLREISPNAVRLYMSATPNTIFPIILKQEIENFQKLSFNKIRRFNGISSQKGIAYFDLKDEFKFIQNIKFFKDIEELQILYDGIGEEPSLTFVDDIKKGKILKEKLGEKANFIYSDGKDKYKDIKEAYHYLIEHETLPCQHLISTSLLLDGVNIKQDINHIVVMLDDEDAVIQAIGRRRIMDKKDRINIYFQHADKNMLRSKYLKHKEMVEMLSLYTNDYELFLRKLNHLQGDSYKGLFYNSLSGVKINSMAEAQVKKMYELYADLYKCYDTDSYKFLKLKCSWLKKKAHTAPKAWITYGVNKQEIDEFHFLLTIYKDICMDKIQFSEFGTIFCRLYVKAYGARKEDNTSRKDYGIQIINSVLNKMKLPYHMVNKNKTYTLIEQ